MLFKILKLFGLDVAAKMDAAKALIEQRAEEVADYAKQATQTAAVIAALSAVCGSRSGYGGGGRPVRAL
jgi:hypothetical protein